jgi:hypothetical protein
MMSMDQMVNVQRTAEMNKPYTPYLIILFLSYLAGAFVAWDLYPGNWDSFGRYLIVLLALAACVINWVITRTTKE